MTLVICWSFWIREAGAAAQALLPWGGPRWLGLHPSRSASIFGATALPFVILCFDRPFPNQASVLSRNWPSSCCRCSICRNRCSCTDHQEGKDMYCNIVIGRWEDIDGNGKKLGLQVRLPLQGLCSNGEMFVLAQLPSFLPYRAKKNQTDAKNLQILQYCTVFNYICHKPQPQQILYRKRVGRSCGQVWAFRWFWLFNINDIDPVWTYTLWLQAIPCHSGLVFDRLEIQWKQDPSLW